MNKIAKSLLLTGLLSLTLGLASCGGAGSGDPVVTFRLNYKSGNDDIFKEVTVKKGECVEEPEEEPTRANYIFDGWHDKFDIDSEFDFEEPIKKSTKIFAHWLARLECTFDYNYSGAPAATKVEVIQKQPVARPADPTRSGYSFIGWSVNKDEDAKVGGYEFYDFATLFSQNITLYAQWGTEGSAQAYRFEAEYCDVITKGMGMTGNTYSGSTNGAALIQRDTGKEDVDASNKHFVHFLYAEGNNLKFEIKSDVAGTAKIDMRLSAEYKEEGFSINSTGEDGASKYTIKVNGEPVNYEKITFTNVPGQGKGWKKFANYPLTASVPLVQGKNTVEMITDNLDKLYGTAVSTAPMIDCLTFETTCTLTWLNAKPSQIL